MHWFRKWLRFIYISYVLNRYNITALLTNLPLLRVLRPLVYLNPLYFFSYRKLSRGERVRLALEKLGPIFIKFGQALSTRRDLLPSDLSDELAKLQDRVPPFCGDYARGVIEKALGKPIDEAFLAFDYKPLASASIAQVHSAEIEDGKKVVVKVLRPNIAKVMRQDTELLRTFAVMIERYIPASRRLKPVEVVEEISRNLFDELDLLREAANASQLKRNFKDSHIHYVPEVYWSYCRKELLVIEKIKGIPVADIEALKAKGVNLKLLAERGVEIFFTQVFRDCFFHADMHPGNIFVDATTPKDPKYISVDFGIVGTLTREDQNYLAGNFLAFFKRDYKRVAELHIESGWVPPETRVDEFESAIRTACEPIFEKPLADISFGMTLLRLFQVARRFNMSVQPQLVLLQKTLLNIEGLGRVLYPELNLWTTAKPFLENWMKSRVGFKGFIKRSIEHLPTISEKLPEAPDLIFDILQALQRQYQRHPHKTPLENEKSMRRYRRRGFVLGIGLALFGFGLLYTGMDDVLDMIQNFMSRHAISLTILGALTIVWYFLTRPKP
ncbi:MAG: ubiquinone biosynthesis regulatory protein kinase UbiB [Francisellaceae bacterium]